MHAEFGLILNVAAAVAVALVGGLLAHRLGQPTIVGYLLAGVAIGPFTPGFVGDLAQIAALAEVGVIFLMFALGIEFSLKELARVKGVALLGTAVQVLLTLGTGLGFGLLLGWPFGQALFFGGVIAIASTMVILKTLLDRGEVTSAHGRVLLGMLVVQDLIVVLLIVTLPQLAGGAGVDAGALARTTLTAAAFVGATVFLGARVVPPFLARVERLGSAELFLLTAVGLALGTAALSALLGLSPALGAFLGGLLLTESEFDHRVVAEVVPMRNLFATLFFVSVGMLIDPRFILANLPAIIGLALAIAAIKVGATLLAITPFRLGSKATAFTALGMLQIGEFSYVLAQTGLAAGAITADLYSLILTSSVLTIVLTPLAFRLAPAAGRALGRLPLLGPLLDGSAAVATEEAQLTGHALVIGHGRVGGQVTAGLREVGVPVSVIEEDLHVVQGLRAAGVPVTYGDASSGAVLAAAGPERARLVVVALPDAGTARAVVREVRRANPTAPILARAARQEEDAALRRAGATGVVAPERAGASLLLAESQRLLDFTAPDGLEPPATREAPATIS